MVECVSCMLRKIIMDFWRCAMGGFDDRDDPGNSDGYLTGKLCLNGCGRPAGTAWSPYLCFECNVERISRIDEQLREIDRGFSRRCEGKQ